MEHFLYLCNAITRYGIESKIQSDNVKRGRCLSCTLCQDIKDKIVYNVDKVANGYMDKDLFKKLDGTDIWEFRTLYKGIQYRLLAFWDTDAETLVIATHGFVKKTQKTPSKEINKAEAIRKLYFNSKK